nr:ANTAR domain-containing protein [Cohnella algarum]
MDWLEKDALKAAELIGKFTDSAVLLLAGERQKHEVREAAKRGKAAYAIKPERGGELAAAIESALFYRRRLQVLIQKFEKLRFLLQQNKEIERAKAKLMKQLRITEDEAHRMLLRTSMSTGISKHRLAGKMVHET